MHGQQNIKKKETG